MEAKKLAGLHAKLEEGTTARGGKTGGLGFDAKDAKRKKQASSKAGKKSMGSQREFATTTAGETLPERWLVPLTFDFSSLLNPHLTTPSRVASAPRLIIAHPHTTTTSRVACTHLFTFHTSAFKITSSCRLHLLVHSHLHSPTLYS